MTRSGKPKGKKSRILGAVLGEVAGAAFGALGTAATAGLQQKEPEQDPPEAGTNTKVQSAPGTEFSSIEVHTQGISGDWLRATGDYDTKSRGALNRDQLAVAMGHLARLETPTFDDACPPHILAQSPSGPLSFISQGGTIYCPETDQEVDAGQACALALGKVAVNPAPVTSIVSSSTSPTKGARPTRRKLGWRGILVMFIALLFFVACAVLVAGGFSMTSRGMSGDDILFIWTLAGIFGFLGLLLVLLAWRRRAYVDENGSVIPFVVMAQLLATGSFDGDDFD
jgi:hypothetical protein